MTPFTEKKWSVRTFSTENHAQELAKALNVSDILTKILVERGVTSFDQAKDFFRPRLDQLHDPFLMKDMKEAVDLLHDSIENGKNILVYGDYDVDGTTSVSLVYSFLSKFTSNIEFYIPDRYSEGYGVSLKGIQYAIDQKIDLFITLDCGIKAHEQIDIASKAGIKVIVCDHHTPAKTLPNAFILNPKREDCNYPYKELSGCGVGFKFLHAYSLQNEIPLQELFNYLDLAAISIAADIVPITGENRTLTYFGLQEINKSPRIGIQALLNQTDKKGEIGIGDLLFFIAPRINAAGRIDTGKRAVELLTCEDKEKAEEIAKIINEQNSDRRGLDQSITEEALDMLKKDTTYLAKKATVVFSEDWHKGVIGIVASRLIETYFRPTIVLTLSNGKITGSARSVQGFDVHSAIDACSEHLEQFGGHKYAAGLTMLPENFDAFKLKFEKIVEERILPDQLIPEIEIDAELSFSEIQSKQGNLPKFYRVLKQMGPFGPENKNPNFITRNVMNAGWTKIVGENHLKLNVKESSSNATIVNGIGFRLADANEWLQNEIPVDIVYSLEENEWKNDISLQLNVKDIKPSK